MRFWLLQPTFIMSLPELSPVSTEPSSSASQSKQSCPSRSPTTQSDADHFRSRLSALEHWTDFQEARTESVQHDIESSSCIAPALAHSANEAFALANVTHDAHDDYLMGRRRLASDFRQLDADSSDTIKTLDECCTQQALCAYAFDFVRKERSRQEFLSTLRSSNDSRLLGIEERYGLR